MPARKTFFANPAWCSICGMFIPNNIVSADHPLFGTVDHVVPLSAGGENCVGNRAPAHRLCNAKKGSALGRIPDEVLCSLQGTISALLVRAGHSKQASDGQMRKARQRISLAIPTKGERREYSLAGSHYVHRWEDDGGYCP